jgi:hypothetical protein
MNNGYGSHTPVNMQYRAPESRPDTVTFRSFNIYNDIDRFLDQLRRHGPTYEPLVRLTRRYAVESHWVAVDAADVEPITPYVIAIASYVRPHGSVLDPAATFDAVNYVPEIVRLEAYCGTRAEGGDDVADQLLRRVASAATALHIRSADGIYEVAWDREAHDLEMTLRYVESSTLDLRAGMTDYWKTLRRLLQARAIGPNAIGFAMLSWDSTDNYGVIADAQGRVYQFDYPHERDAADIDFDTLMLQNWQIVEDAFDGHRLQDYAEAALLLRAEESGISVVIGEPPTTEPAERDQTSRPSFGDRQFKGYWHLKAPHDIEHFAAELSAHPADYEPFLGVEECSIVDWRVAQIGASVAIELLPQHVIVQASYIRTTGSTYFPTRPFHDQHLTPIFSLGEVYCGQCAVSGAVTPLAADTTRALQDLAKRQTLEAVAGGYRPALYIMRAHRTITHTPAEDRVTPHLRSSLEGFWPTLRAQLLERGVDARTSVMAWATWEGSYYYYIIMTAGRRIFQFDYFAADGSYASRFDRGDIRDWVELTDCWEVTAYRTDILEALQMLDNEDRARNDDR